MQTCHARNVHHGQEIEREDEQALVWSTRAVVLYRTKLPPGKRAVIACDSSYTLESDQQQRQKRLVSRAATDRLGPANTFAARLVQEEGSSLLSISAINAHRRCCGGFSSLEVVEPVSSSFVQG